MRAQWTTRHSRIPEHMGCAPMGVEVYGDFGMGLMVMREAPCLYTPELIKPCNFHDHYMFNRGKRLQMKWMYFLRIQFRTGFQFAGAIFTLSGSVDDSLCLGPGDPKLRVYGIPNLTVPIRFVNQRLKVILGKDLFQFLQGLVF